MGLKLSLDKLSRMWFMDLVMPVMAGCSNASYSQQMATIKIIALTSFKEKEMVEGALKAGALSYLLKNVSAEELTSTIHDAVTGQAKLSPEAAQVLETNLNDNV
jgi:NarL family two-component system response regulator LiaR